MEDRASMMPEPAGLVSALSRNWWAVALRGAFAVLFGILSFAWPEITVVVLVALFGAWALIDGILLLASAWRRAERGQTWWPLLLEGLLGVAAAAVTFLWPDITALALLFVIGAWAIVTGILEIAAAIAMRRVIDNEVWLGLAGIAGILFGVIVLLFPGAGALGIVWLIATYAIVFGVFLLMLGFRLRSYRPPTTPAAAPEGPDVQVRGERQPPNGSASRSAEEGPHDPRA
jgi:uncharacterized membrane protein HdeD (DUF308 family)